jgi:hypothetical protein
MKIYKNNWSSRECYFVEWRRQKGRCYGIGVLRYNTARGKDRWVVRRDYSYKESDIDDVFQFEVVGNINLEKLIAHAVLDVVKRRDKE